MNVNPSKMNEENVTDFSAHSGFLRMTVMDFLVDYVESVY